MYKGQCKCIILQASVRLEVGTRTKVSASKQGSTCIGILVHLKRLVHVHRLLHMYTLKHFKRLVQVYRLVLVYKLVHRQRLVTCMGWFAHVCRLVYIQVGIHTPDHVYTSLTNFIIHLILAEMTSFIRKVRTRTSCLAKDGVYTQISCVWGVP